MIRFLVEESSMQAFLEALLPRLGYAEGTYHIITHRGKGDLLQSLDKIRSLSRISTAIVVLIDQDLQDCKKLKQEIMKKIHQQNDLQNYPLWIRIVCRELESWFIGDLSAVAKAFPQFNAERERHKRKYQNPDQLDKPSAILLKWLAEHTCSKIEIARRIGSELDVNTDPRGYQNRSSSFHHLMATLRKLQPQTTELPE